MEHSNNDAAKVKFFPPGIPLIAVVTGIVLNRILPITVGVSISQLSRYVLGGIIVVGAVSVLGVWSVVLFRKKGQSENPWKPTPKIECTGPFSVTRNPMYLQMVLVCIGLAILLGNWWILALTPAVVWGLRYLAIDPEEAYLEEKFGETYREYKRQVRRWI